MQPDHPCKLWAPRKSLIAAESGHGVGRRRGRQNRKEGERNGVETRAGVVGVGSCSATGVLAPFPTSNQLSLVLLDLGPKIHWQRSM